jgi:hypothetical protein
MLCFVATRLIDAYRTHKAVYLILPTPSVMSTIIYIQLALINVLH